MRSIAKNGKNIGNTNKENVDTSNDKSSGKEKSSGEKNVTPSVTFFCLLPNLLVSNIFLTGDISGCKESEHASMDNFQSMLKKHMILCTYIINSSY